MAKLKNGFYITNLCETESGAVNVRLEAYDANKVKVAKQKSPILGPRFTRYVSNKQIGSTNFIYVLIFFSTKEYNPPPGIGIKQGTHGGGGSLGITIIGIGGSIGASATVTEAYSQPAGALQVYLEGSGKELYGSVDLFLDVTKGKNSEIKYNFSIQKSTTPPLFKPIGH